MKKYSNRFSRIAFNNRWKRKKVYRDGGQFSIGPWTIIGSNWVILGVQRWFSCPQEYCFALCFFGFEVLIWFERKFVKYER